MLALCQQNSLSLSIISTSVIVLSPSVMPNGNNSSIILMVNSLFCLNSKSSIIGISIEELLVPVENITLNRPPLPISP